ncbi:tail fiber domain-containing protein, partial [Porticoccaceae bacterium]|nr:tail fiber domain-containing protein [Porticoccaceae bacterium]
VTADSLTVDTNTLYVDSTNDRVGIGTASPDQKLQVDGNIRLGDTATGVDDDEDYGLKTGGSLTLHANDSGNNTAYTALAFDVGNASGSQAASSKIQFRVNNTERMRIDSSGNVGIGTSSPDGKLDIEGDFETTKALVLTNTKGAGKVTYIRSHGADGEALALYHDGQRRQIWDSTGYIAFEGTDGAEDMRIDSSGNVGIGTTTISNPVNYSKVLNIAGTAPALVLSEDSGRDYTIGVNGNKFSIFDETDAVLTIDDAGNVGIGTTSPQSDGNTTNLEVSSANGARVLVNNTDTSGRKYGIYSDNSGRFGFADYTADATRMLIDSSGNLGIGTASPAARLDVKNNTALGGTDGDWLLLSRIQSHTGNQTDLEIGNLRDSTGSTWQQAGTRIQSKIDATYMGYMQFNGTGNEHGISFGVGASTVSHDSIPEVMRITSSGNVLVGKTSGDNATAGLELNANGQLVGTFANGTHVLGRNGSDGNILAFIKDGADMGSIGTVLASGARYFYIGNNASNSGIGFYATGIYPSNGLGGFSSGNKNLGSSTVRWLTAYLSQQPNVSSDQRLKQNIEDADDAGSTIDAIQVRKFDWIEDGRHQKYGMIAQELAEVYPEAVNVAENEEDTLGIATGDLIPMLIKEVQSLRSRVAELESK